MSAPGPVPKHQLEFSCIRSEYYELDMNFDETELKNKIDHTSYNKIKLFCENIVVIEEECFYDMNLTDGATFTTALIERKNSIINKKNNIPRDTKRNILKIAIKNGWNT